MVKLRYTGNANETYPTCGNLTVTRGWVGDVDEKIAKKLMGTKKFKVVKPKREETNGNT